MQGAVGPLWISGPMKATEHTAPMAVQLSSWALTQPRCGLCTKSALCWEDRVVKAPPLCPASQQKSTEP